MPNPIKKLKKFANLRPKQKELVKRIKRQGLIPVGYRRTSNINKLSVHNPFLDVIRKSKKPSNVRYPHASDTKGQRKLSKTKARTYSTTRKKVTKKDKSFLFP